MRISKKCPKWFDNNKGIYIHLFIYKVMVILNSKTREPICWAYAKYEPDKANGFRGGNHVNSWHGTTKKFKRYLFHMQPILISSLNKILKANHQKPVTPKQLRQFANRQVTSIHYPLQFQAGVMPSERFGEVFTFDNLKLRKIIKKQRNWNDFEASLPDPGQNNYWHHHPSDPEL